MWFEPSWQTQGSLCIKDFVTKSIINSKNLGFRRPQPIVVVDTICFCLTPAMNPSSSYFPPCISTSNKFYSLPNSTLGADLTKIQA